MATMKIKKDDMVQVIAGKDKGKEGKVLSVDAKNNKVLVEGVNIVHKHSKPSMQNQQGCSSSLSDADAAISVAVSAATDDDTSSVVTCPFPIELLFFTKPIMPIITEKQITLPKKNITRFFILSLSP